MLQLSQDYFKKHIDDFSIDDTLTLKKVLEFHSNLYYNKEEPIISDYEYDILLEKIIILEEKYHIQDKF
jgi:DNA ligase (NAD+)